jgi:hypothetical protein
LPHSSTRERGHDRHPHSKLDTKVKPTSSGWRTKESRWTFHLGEKIFAAVRHIDRNEEKIAYLRGHYTSFDVESRMAKLRLVGKCVAPDV